MKKLLLRILAAYGEETSKSVNLVEVTTKIGGETK